MNQRDDVPNCPSARIHKQEEVLFPRNSIPTA
jgi:hypothetical protein